VVRIVVGSGPAVAHAGQLKGSSETEGAHDLDSVRRPGLRGRHTAIFGRRAVAADGPLPKVGIDFLLESVDFLIPFSRGISHFRNYQKPLQGLSINP